MNLERRVVEPYFPSKSELETQAIKLAKQCNYDALKILIPEYKEVRYENLQLKVQNAKQSSTKYKIIIWIYDSLILKFTKEESNLNNLELSDKER